MIHDGSPKAADELDRRFMAAAIRLSERHVGLTATNPSVATLLVRDDGEGPHIVGRGITAPGGRPHAERIALDEAGEAARGATAYVTLEPCAHHGRTPPCAEALVSAGVGRVVAGAPDPDPRVDGQGHDILRRAGIPVAPCVDVETARRAMSGYLVRHRQKRPEVLLKIAVSPDGMIGLAGHGQVAITGPIANRQTHLLRARSDVVMIGAGTAREDDPLLTCRLPGLEGRSPLRLVLDPSLTLPPLARLVSTIGAARTMVAVAPDAPDAARRDLAARGCEFLACERDPETGGIALPEMLEDLGASGLSSVLVEGGARLAKSLLDSHLVDRLILVLGETSVGPDGVPAPILEGEARERFRLARSCRFGADRWLEFEGSQS